MITGGYQEVDGVRTFVEVAGSGDSVVCLHSAGQSGLQWRHVLEELPASGYQVIVPDFPGHGRSMPWPGGPVRDLGDYAQWCLTLVDVLELDRPFIVGCSIGGKIALDLAVRAGDRLRGIVACACDAHNRRLSPDGLIRSLPDSASPSRTDRTYLGTLAAVGRDVSRERAELIAQLHRREDPIVTTFDLVGWATHDLRARLVDAGCVAVLVAGQDDFWIDIDATRRAAEAMPRARFEMLQRIGHYPMEEMVDFSARLDGWLADLRRMGAS